MSILPAYHDGRVSIPWWYGLGYLVGWTMGGWIFGIWSDTMDIILSNISLIAMVVCAFVGSAAFMVFNAVSKYEKQKTDAEKVKNKIVSEGRDPENPDQLTIAEKWEINKASKFDKIFLFADAGAVILGTLLACAVLLFRSEAIGADAWDMYAVYGLVLGMIATWLIYEMVLKYVAAGEWQKKTADAFRIVKAVADEAAEVSGGYPALVQKFIDNGFSKKEAQKLAKDAIIANPDILKPKEE
jgi:uncharacterized membrane protein